MVAQPVDKMTLAINQEETPWVPGNEKVKQLAQLSEGVTYFFNIDAGWLVHYSLSSHHQSGGLSTWPPSGSR